VTWGPLSSTVGTPDYMAPEQVRGQRGDERTDVYALGVMLYEMLRGETPFQGDNPLAILSQRVSRDPPRVRSARPEVSPALDAVVARALQRDPSDRYPTMAAFLDDLNHPDRVDLSPKVVPRTKAGERWSRVPGWFVVALTLLTLGPLGFVAEVVHRLGVVP
jgi:eukaryotic-like serine/threonine-protein kinase